MPVLHRQAGVPVRQAEGSPHRQVQESAVSRRAAQQERLGRNFHGPRTTPPPGGLRLCCFKRLCFSISLLRGCMCSSSLSSWFWPDPSPETREAASRCIASPFLWEPWLWRTSRMEISALAAPSEGLSPMGREVGGVALLLLDCEVPHCLILLPTALTSVSLQLKTFSASAPLSPPSTSATPCMSTTSTTSSSGSTVCAQPWPSNRGLHPEFSQKKLPQPHGAPPVQPAPVAGRRTRTFRTSPSLSWGLRHCPKADLSRSPKALWRGKKLECRSFSLLMLQRLSWKILSPLLTSVWILIQPLCLCAFLCLCSYLRVLRNHVRPRMTGIFALAECI